jgi:sugar O-acyltransferase (sialic acid O-acetyltransferase NeuD family)
MYVLVGAGGHAKVITDILKSNNYPIKGFIDDHIKETSFLGYQVLGSMDTVSSLIEQDPSLSFIISIGSNAVRQKLADQLTKLGVTFGIAIHPSAIISESAEIGAGTVVMPNCVINAQAKVGEHCIINTAAVVEHECQVQDFVHLSPGALLAGNVKVGEGTHVGIGAKAIQNIVIGSHTVVGAGSVIIRDLPDQVKVVGVPAREIL